jgi:Stage II sporulation protein E (SpoIIE)
MLLYTDGLTEARGRGEFFGLDRVNAALGEMTDPTPSQPLIGCAPVSRSSPTARLPTICACWPPGSTSHAESPPLASASVRCASATLGPMLQTRAAVVDVTQHCARPPT